MRHEVMVIWAKEMLDTFRDRRTIMTMIVVPMLLYPVLLLGFSQLIVRQIGKMEESSILVAIEPSGVAPRLEGLFEEDSGFTLVEVPNSLVALDQQDIDMALSVPHDLEQRLARGDSVNLTMRLDLSRDDGQMTRSRAEDILRSWKSDIVNARLAKEGLNPQLVDPFELAVRNIADSKKMGGFMMGKILPFLLVAMILTGAMYPAIDLTAGERERGTLETLLVSPASRASLVLGKYLTVLTVAMLTALVNLVSLGFTASLMMNNMGMGDVGAFDITTLLLVLLIMLPLALFISALAMVIASLARSFKEAQNLISPALIAVLIPGYITMVPGIELNHTMALTPIANVIMVAKELFLGNRPWNYYAESMAIMAGLALLLLTATVRLFNTEAMISESDGARLSFKTLFTSQLERAEKITATLAGQIFAVVLLAFFYLGIPWQLSDPKWGLLGTQVLILAGLPLLGLKLFRVPVKKTLGLGGVNPRLLLLAVLMAPLATVLAGLAAEFQGFFLEVPQSYVDMMRDFVQGEFGGLWTTLFFIALTPAICEEVLFRGLILRGLLSRMSPAWAIFGTAILFGAFHMDLYRLLPTAVLGMVLGWLAWRTGRLWPAVVLHGANNATAVLIEKGVFGDRFSWLQAGESIPLSVVAVVLVVGLLAAWGIHGIARGRQIPSPPGAESPGTQYG